LGEEKEYALKDYQSKIAGQEKQKQMLAREKQELDRLINNKDTENGGLTEKYKKNRDRSSKVDTDY
jgi:hypothetical protein